MLNPNHYFRLLVIEIKTVKWNMGISTAPLILWGKNTGHVIQNKLANRRLIVINETTERKAPKLFSFEELYNLASKFYFDIAIETTK